MADRETSPTSKKGVAEQISALGARLSRVLTGESASTTETVLTAVEKERLSQEATDDTASLLKERSVSRGREFHSSGRGGVGNIRPSSASLEHTSPRVDGPDDFSVTRGREPRSPVGTGQVVSTGRGGAGNIHSPSRDISGDGRRRPAGSLEDDGGREYEDSVIRSSDDARSSTVRSSGRGGVGNIARSPQSKSRSRSRGPQKSTPLTSTKTANPTALGDVPETDAGSAGNDDEPSS
ncbi:hypothetical protein EW146_g3965 [Bondarzewia mesenterica]|uniref:Uncharacterized protein n=1 Tax=Bondarzewia mesenterica TaxID=1095465 RepID=A0A4S4LVX5_9AGAM|nr:hypothetical protein EW146_g3965 [Bondarzewia mesenterica]